MRQTKKNRSRRQEGFSLIEMVIVMAIILILSAVAIPMVTAAVNAYRLRSATNAVTGLIKTTRFQAMSAGYPYQIIFTEATSSYQLQQDTLINPNTGQYDGNYVNVTSTGSSGTISGTSANVTFNTDLTLQFSPSGAVKYVTGNGVAANLAATSCSNGNGANCTLTLSYSRTPNETIVVTGYGNVTVTP